MRKLIPLFTSVVLFISFQLIQATPISSTTLSSQILSTDNTSWMLQAVTQTDPLPASDAPQFGTYYSAQFGEQYPPLPTDLMDLPFWDIGGGFYIYDDRNVDYTALRAEGDSQSRFASPMARMTIAASSLLNSSYAYGNPVYLTNIVASLSGTNPVTVTFEIVGGTNFVPYDILTTSNLNNPLSSWSWIGVGYTSNYYTFSNQPPGSAFYILAKPRQTMVVAWGNDVSGQCDIPSGLTNVVMVAGGGGQSLALRNDGTVAAWGENAYGEGAAPTNLSGVTMVAAGWYHDVALLTNGSVTAWGLDAAGIYNLTNVPSNLTNATVISAQALHTIALASNGTVVAWGYNGFGEGAVPAGLSNVIAIAAGYEFNLVVLSNGTVTAWGENSLGQTNVPFGLTNVVDVAAGPYHCLALLGNGTVVAWGDNTYGATNVPMGLTNVVAIAAGGDPFDSTAYSLALKADGTVIAWGSGQPVASVQGMSNVFSLGAGADHALAIRTGPPTPVIIIEPIGLAMPVCTNLVLSSAGEGIFGVSYQWEFNGSPLSGATNSSLTLDDVQVSQTGTYNVLVSGTGGSILSSNAYLSVTNTPLISITQQPTDQYQVAGGTVMFSCSAVARCGTPLTYQWEFGGTNITDATNASLTVTNAQAGQEGIYNVLVTSSATNLLSSNANLYLVTAPVIVSNTPLTNQVLYYQSDVTYTVQASAVGQSNGFPISYQWQLNGTNIPYANTNFYTANANPNALGNYSVIASNVVGMTNIGTWQFTINYGTLSYYLATNLAAYTNGRSGSSADLQIVSNWSYAAYFPSNLYELTNAVLSPYCWLHGVRGLSASSIGTSNVYNIFGAQKMLTMISPRHFLIAAHVYPGTNGILVPVAFLDTNNEIYWRTPIQRTFLGNDITVGILDSDLPNSGEYLPLCPSNFVGFLPTNSSCVVQGLGMNQGLAIYSRAFTAITSNSVLWATSPTMVPFGPGTNWWLPVATGDSSSPVKILINGQLVLISANTGIGEGPYYGTQIGSINSAMHYLSTNNNASTDYQLTIYSITNWPQIH